jgi:hypothetical protein
MNIPNDIALWLQSNLRTLAEDDSSCAYFLSGNVNTVPYHTRPRWQLAVGMIYRCVRSKLTLISNFVDCDDEASFFVATRSLNPFTSEGGLLWNGTLLYGSETLTTIVEKHFSSSQAYSPDIDHDFIEELDRIFKQNGVDWSETPLLPITGK